MDPLCDARRFFVQRALCGRLMVGKKWAHVVRTPPDRKVAGAGPVGSGHGSYQLVSWWGGQCWCPPMAHAQWWQSGSAIRDVATSAQHGMRSPFRPTKPYCESYHARITAEPGNGAAVLLIAHNELQQTVGIPNRVSRSACR